MNIKLLLLFLLLFFVNGIMSMETNAQENDSFAEALNWAAENNQPDNVTTILDMIKKLDPLDIKKIILKDNPHGDSYFLGALFWTARYNQPDNVKTMLSMIKLFRVDSNVFIEIISNDDFSDALRWNAENNQPDNVATMLEMINKLNSLDIKKIILKDNPHGDSYFLDALRWAARYNQPDNVKTMLDMIKKLDPLDIKDIILELNSDEDSYFLDALFKTAEKENYGCFVLLLYFVIENLKSADIPGLDNINEEEEETVSSKHLDNFIEKLKDGINKTKKLKNKKVPLSLIDYFMRREFRISGTLSKFKASKLDLFVEKLNNSCCIRVFANKLIYTKKTINELIDECFFSLDTDQEDRTEFMLENNEIFKVEINDNLEKKRRTKLVVPKFFMQQFH